MDFDFGGIGIAEQQCAKCKQILFIMEFRRDLTRTSGRYPYCRACKRGVDRADHAKHAPARRVRNRANYRANPAPYKARARARYQADPEGVKAYVRDWQRQNPENRRAISKRYSQAHREVGREAWRRRHARKMAAAVIPFTLDQLAAKMAYWGNRCWVCRGPQEAVDHVKPLAKGGLHILANLRPICRSCNTRKRDRWPLTA